MKTRNTSLLVTLAICGAALLLPACSKKEEPATPPAGDAQKSTETTAGDLQMAATNAAANVQQQADDLKSAATTAITNTLNQADTNALAQPALVQTLIDQAKGLVAEKKYTEALSSLTDLSKFQLTAEQQQLVDTLKAQIQKAVAGQAASDAAKSVGGLLNK